jgi:hypothetical protein
MKRSDIYDKNSILITREIEENVNTFKCDYLSNMNATQLVCIFLKNNKDKISIHALN